MTRFTALLVAAAALAALAAAPAASAASIAYVAGDGNVHLVAADGSRDLAITANATADSKYRSPSQLDDGRVVALRRAPETSSSFAFFLGRDGQMLDSWLLPSSGSGGFSPYRGAEASPEGGMIVYDYRHFDCASYPCEGNQRVGFVAGSGQTNPCLINCYVGYVAPRWVPGTPYAAMVDQSFHAAYVQQQGSAYPVGWFQYEGGISLFELDVRAGRIVTSVGEQEYMVLEKMTGAPPAAPQSQCSVNMPDDARPRLSPDGSMIAWSAPEGVMVSPTPTQSGGTGTLCQLSPQLVAAGGSEPAWGVTDVASPSVPGGGGGGGGGGQNGAAGAKLTAVTAPKLAKALAQGFVVGFRCSGACKAKASASVSKAIAKRFGLGKGQTKIGTGKASLAAAGSGKVKIAFTAKARRHLAGAGKVPIAVVVEISDAGGAHRALRKTVTLKR